MGTFFTNVQVHRDGLSAEAARLRILEHLHEGMTVQEKVVKRRDASAEDVRNVLVGPASQGPWYAIYDSATESQDDRDIVRLTKLLSTANPECFAVGVRVHDGDRLDLWLFQNGAERDHVCNWSGYFAGRPPPKRAAGKPAAWRSLLVSGASSADLLAAWENVPRPDGPAILERMAPLLGWEKDAVTVGFRSLPESLRERCTELTFRFPSQPTEAPRLPALGHVGGTPDSLGARVGDRISPTAVAHNSGGNLQGLSIVLFGPVIEEGLLRPEGLTVVVGNPRSARLVHASFAPSLADPYVFTAQLPDVALPAGYADMAAAYRATANAEQAIGAWMAARVEAKPAVRVFKTGSGDLHIGLVPAENPEGGQTSWTVHIHADA